MREYLFDLATMPPTRCEALPRLAREAGAVVAEACIAAALLPRPRTRPYARACRSAALWPLRPALRVVTE